MSDPYKHISLTLKTLRRERGWSLDKTAAETGVSKAMLGQIEREESSPTIATLWKIASGFQTSFSTFLTETEGTTKDALYRTGEATKLARQGDMIRVTPIFPFDEQLHCEIFIIELLPGCEHLSEPHKTGVIEHVIVIEGCIEVLLNGDWKKLQKGEGLRFDAGQPHGYRNITKENAGFHNIIHYQS